MIDYFVNDRWHPENYKPTIMDDVRWTILKDGILNPLRAHLGAPIVITNGLRTQATYDRLVREGYHPSVNSDHFWGHYPNELTTAAVDIVVKGTTNYKAILNSNLTMWKFTKQVIWESQDGKPDWLHISLANEMIFSSAVCSRIKQKPRFMRGINGVYYAI